MRLKLSHTLRCPPYPSVLCTLHTVHVNRTKINRYTNQPLVWFGLVLVYLLGLDKICGMWFPKGLKKLVDSSSPFLSLEFRNLQTFFFRTDD